MSLFDHLLETVTAYRTCEFATLAKDGTPITWPAAALPRADGTLTLTTSLGFPQKAFNIRRDGRVALLFSDPTGSGLDTPDQVLVKGTATCPDEIVTSPGELTEYWWRLFDRQPSSRAYLKPLMRPVVDWYYMRLVITVTPSTVTTRPGPAPAAGPPVPTELLGAATLAGYPSAVLGGRDPDGAPVLCRVRPVPSPSGYRVEIPEDVEISPGPASLLVHRHDEHLANLRFALVRGELAQLAGQWSLAPSQLVKPSDSAFGVLRQSRRNTRDYLRRRDLARPQVDWRAFTAIAMSPRPHESVNRP